MPQPAKYPGDDEIRIVVADIHGNYRSLYLLLLKAGAINEDGSRNPGYWVAQLGDLIHGGNDVWQADLDTVLLANQWIDCQLVGNHDLPFLTQRIESRFAGQHPQLIPGLQACLDQGVRGNRYLAAVCVDGWLITHAGADPRLLRGKDLDERQLADYLQDLWSKRLIGDLPANPLTDWIGSARGGKAYTGSIFWCSWEELMRGYQKCNSQLKQIVGHTARKGSLPQQKLTVWNIDLQGINNGFIAALKSAAPESHYQQEWQPVVVERVARPDPKY